MTLLEKFQSGDIRALSKLISFVENREPGYQDLLGQLYMKAGQAVRVGITGPPGAGKSTLVNTLAKQFLASGKRVGIIAVDPSSPFTGGALLGDRVRVAELPTDGSAYFRSMATRGASGGLAAATNNVGVVLDAFGFDIVIIETVGVGQVELDIIDACDSVVVVLVPESGDAVQTLKAGLMEIADVFCVNKADRPGSQRMVADIKLTLGLRSVPKDGWAIPIISTEAVNKVNLDKLYKAITDHLEYTQANGLFEQHRHLQLRRKVLAILTNRFQREFIDSLEAESRLDEAITPILSGDSNPYLVAADLYRRFSGKLSRS